MNMPKTFLSILACVVFLFPGYGQEKVKEKDILGRWKLVIDMENIKEEEIEEDIEDENAVVKAFVNAVTGFVFDIMDEIDIEFQFEEDGLMRSYADVFNNSDYERGEWFINKYGGLEFDTDIEINESNDQAWFLVDDILVPCDRKGRYIDEENVYLVRLD
jgi:hypothetical protein